MLRSAVTLFFVLALVGPARAADGTVTAADFLKQFGSESLARRLTLPAVGAKVRVLPGPTVEHLLELPVSPESPLAVRVVTPAADRAFKRLSYRAAEWYGSTFWTGPDWTRVGKDWQHTGKNTPSVRCFQAPEGGQMTISGRAFKLHKGGDGVKLQIWHDLRKLWEGEIEGNDDQGVTPEVTVAVECGDRLRFVVEKRGTINCDTTGWDPVIRYADGTTYRASEGFSTSRQGDGGWFYEMQVAEPGDSGFMAMTHKTGMWYGSTYWQAKHVWCRVGKNWHHPGDGVPSVRGFRVPKAGMVTVNGRVFALHEGGDGTEVSIQHNGVDVWRAEIGGEDTKGQEVSLRLELGRGDTLRFVVAQGSSISCDTTGWDPVITYADGTRYQASAAFGNKQGKGGWFYEAQTLASPKAPRCYVIGADTILRPVRLMCNYGFRSGAPLGERRSPAVAARTPNRRGRRLSRKRPVTPPDMPAEPPAEAVLVPGGQTSLAASSRPAALVISDSADASGLLVLLPGTVDREWVLALDTKSEKLTLAWSERAENGRGASLSVLPYDGPHTAALLAFAALADAPGTVGLRDVSPTPDDPRPRAELPTDLFLLTQAEWLREDRIDGMTETYEKAARDHVARAQVLLRRLGKGQPSSFLASESSELSRLSSEIGAEGVPPDSWARIHTRARLLKRRIAFSNPLLDFQRLVFCKRRLCRWSHLNMQYFGWRQRSGGGIFVLENMGRSIQVRSVLRDQLPPGSVLEPRLSYDGKRVVFSYVECGDRELAANTLEVNEEGGEEGYFHICEVGVDGSGFRQLTRGRYDDVMPNYLPDGGIVFCSTRRRGYARCFGGNYSRRWHSYTVHRMDADGGNITTLSFNDVAEWFPAVSNTGYILFARWDYIDRDAVTHQNLWSMRPDGTNQLAVWGNGVSKPHCTFQAKPVPNSSKIAFIASAHHALTGGPVCLVDPTVDSNSNLDAITRITPQPFPEAESFNLPDYYESVWPLSETDFLVGYSNTYLRSQGRSYEDPTPDNALGLYWLDADGNRELIYRDPALNSSTPIPLRGRPRPPVLPSVCAPDAEEFGELVVTDVHEGLGDIPRDSIKAIRVVQIFPKITPWANTPLIGFAGEENARAVLGTVPVEPDGSARFLVPARKPLLFQALDKDGLAFQTMRSATSLRPGERTSCIGCHENRMTAPVSKPPMALTRRPSRIRPGPYDGKPFSYMTVVQPIWDKHCVSCHGDTKPKGGICMTRTPQKGFAASYWALCDKPRVQSGANTNPKNASKVLVPCFGQRNRVDVTPPGGIYGARGSRLIKMLRKGHSRTTLSVDELRRVAMWIDLNALFYGAYKPERQAEQLAGREIPMPEIQ